MPGKYFDEPQYSPRGHQNGHGVPRNGRKDSCDTVKHCAPPVGTQKRLANLTPRRWMNVNVRQGRQSISKDGEAYKGLGKPTKGQRDTAKEWQQEQKICTMVFMYHIFMLWTFWGRMRCLKELQKRYPWVSQNFPKVCPPPLIVYFFEVSDSGRLFATFLTSFFKWNSLLDTFLCVTFWT